MSQLVLAFDVVNQALVPYQGSPSALPQFRQGVYDLTIYLVQPVTDVVPGLNEYEAFDSTGYDSIRVGIWKDSTGTLDDSSEYVLALAPSESWTYDDSNPDYPVFTGQLNCNTAEMAAFIGADTHKAAYFAVNLVAGAVLHPVFDHRLGATNCTVNSATDDASGVLPVAVTDGRRLLQLPVYLRSEDGAREYVITENETQDGIVFSQYTP